MSYYQKCEILNMNLVLVGGSDLLGEIKYYVIRVEFPFHGSPRIYHFLCVHSFLSFIATIEIK